MTSHQQRLGPTDSVLWEIERDPVLRSPILVVAVLDREPDAARLTASFERAVAEIPRLHQRIRANPLRGQVWEDDPSFSLAHHLRRMRAPHPADLRTVLDIAQPVLSGDFDRHRALWEAHLVEGVDGGRSALVLKIHHAATDGVGGVALAGSLFDTDPDGDEGAGRPDAAPMPVSRVRRLLDETVGLAGTAQRVTDAAAQAARHPLAAARDAARTAGSVARLLEPIRTPLSPLMRGRGLTHHLDVVDVPMAELERAARHAGGTLNDAYLAAVAHGLTRYHERHGETVPSLRITMPISLREEGDPMGGNRFAPVRFEIPLGIDDPAERIRTLGTLAHRWRDDPALGFTEVIATGLRRLPPAAAAGALGGMFKGIDVDAVNVPGVPVPIWLAGAGVQRLYAFAPPTGAALSVTLLSHVDTACIGIQTDDVAVPDPESMAACIVEGLDDVVASGARPAPARRAESAR